MKKDILKQLKQKDLSFYQKAKLFEEFNIKHNDGKKEAAYYTKEEVVQKIVEELPLLKNKDHITILEPSVGIGNFIPYILKKYYSKKKITLILNDTNKFSLECLKLLLDTYIKENNIENVEFNYINSDYLKNDFSKYNIDIIVGNPPYFSIKDKTYLKELKQTYNDKTTNIFAYFIHKAIKESDIVSFIIPKGILFAGNYKKLRSTLHQNISNIIDYQKAAFKVNLETISFLYNKKDNSDNVVIKNYLNNTTTNTFKSYIFQKEFPIWLIYRNKEFDTTLNKIQLGCFDVFRDRQITNKMLNDENGKWILRGRNLKNNSVIHIKNYDKYILEYKNLTVFKKINNYKDKIIIAPNLTQYPRFNILPENTIVNGSVALFFLKDNLNFSQKDIDFLNSKEFMKYFDIVRNKSKLTINLDNYIGFFIGILK